MELTEVRFAGSGGQGLILSARMLFRALSIEGKTAARSQGYEPTSRGGFCFSDVVAGHGDLDYPLSTSLDYLLALDQVGVAPSQHLLKKGALVIADERLTPEPPTKNVDLYRAPLTDQAIAIGSIRVANIIGLGLMCGLGGICAKEALAKAIASETPKNFLELNLEALDVGFATVDELKAA
ncbi:MAG: 2-oxoacid:acceptor oxidoreductase family protein [Rhodospirillales bacterium]|nr:2-oxoacid:acceptor oxidoreductase family protein [Rhodospirillales bacterium]